MFCLQFQRWSMLYLNSIFPPRTFDLLVCNFYFISWRCIKLFWWCWIQVIANKTFLSIMPVNTKGMQVNIASQYFVKMQNKYYDLSSDPYLSKHASTKKKRVEFTAQHIFYNLSFFFCLIAILTHIRRICICKYMEL